MHVVLLLVTHSLQMIEMISQKPFHNLPILHVFPFFGVFLCLAKKKNAALFFNVCINDFYIYIYIFMI